MAGQKSNVLGQHFTEPAPGQAKCNICSELVSMGAETGKTTNMWNHLKHHHLPVYKETQKEKEGAAREDLLQPTVTQLFDNIWLK
ncbi:hypothetical protein MHYP_G00018570 [Metynnis hypsauchen]